MRTLVVLPTYNEAENVVPILEAIREAAPDVDVLVVDDASPDGTGKLAVDAGSRLGHIDVLHREGKAGLGKAYRAGFAVGLERGYDALVEMDADFSHDPAALPSLLAAAEQHEVVIGSRYVQGAAIPNWRSPGSRCRGAGTCTPRSSSACTWRTPPPGSASTGAARSTRSATRPSRPRGTASRSR